MPDVLETPPTARHLPEALRPFIWTRDEAKQAALRSVAARQLRAAAHSDAPLPTLKDGVSTVVNAQLRLVAEQITRTRAVLNDVEVGYCPACERAGIEPHHRAQLLRALDTLLDRQRKLMGISDPAPRKQSEGRGRKESPGAFLEIGAQVSPVAPAQVAPIAPVVPTAPPPPSPAVAAQEPARPLGYEYDTPTGGMPPAVPQ